MNSDDPIYHSAAFLAADLGTIGQELRRFAEFIRMPEICREADRWPDPWQFLLRLSDVPENYRTLFRAARSQRTALNRIAEIARRGGSIEHSWSKEMMRAIKAEDWEAARHAEDKVLFSYWHVDQCKALLAAAQRTSPAIFHEAKARVAALESRLNRKFGRRKAAAIWGVNEFNPDAVTEKIAWELACGWMRNQGGSPGYSFFTDDALRDALAILFKMPRLAFDTVRKTRQFLGLRKATLFIHHVEADGVGLFRLLDRHRQLLWPQGK